MRLSLRESVQDSVKTDAISTQPAVPPHMQAGCCPTSPPCCAACGSACLLRCVAGCWKWCSTNKLPSGLLLGAYPPACRDPFNVQRRDAASHKQQLFGLPLPPPQSMAMVLHSYASLNFTPHELLDAAAEHMALNLPHYSTQARAGRVAAGWCGRMLLQSRS